MQEITLNLIPDGIAERVAVNQLDTNRTFAIRILDGYNEYTIPQSGVTFSINGRKADGNVFDYPATYEDPDTHTTVTVISVPLDRKTIVVHTTQQMTAAAGECLAQIVLEDTTNARVIGTLNFIMDVQEMPAGGELPSDSDLPMIIAQAKEQEAHAAASAAAAAISATTAGAAKDDAVSAKNDAVSAKNTAVDAATRAEAIEAHPPRLDPPGVTPNGNWWVWDNTLNPPAYKDSGVDAGVSCDVDPNAVTLPYNSNVTVENTGTQTDPRFKFSIPQGKSAYQTAVDGGYQGTEQQFNTDLGNFTTYASNAQTAATNAGNSETAAGGSANAAAGSASDSEAYAVGKRGGTDVPSTDPAYHNNSKYYSEQASTSASNASSSAGLAAQSATSAHDDMLTTDGYKTAAQTYASNASDAAVAAAGYKNSAEGYADNAQQSAGAAQVSETNASGSSTTAARRAQDAEAWAVGQRGGEDVPSTDSTYHNNSKYYSEQAAASAAATADVSTGSTGKTVKVAINPTSAQISAYDNGAIWIET